MTAPKPLSPAAQAVLDAANGASSYGLADCLNDAPQIAVATLRAAADQADSLMERCGSPQQAEGRSDWFHALLEIATELEGVNG